MYGEYLTALTRREALERLSESMSRAQRMGLQPSELPNEEQEEHEEERSRVLTILGVAGLASSMPREAISSMKEGRAAIKADDDLRRSH